MKKSIIATEIICDCCGKTFTTADGNCCYAGDERGYIIEDEALDSEWLSAGELHFCPDCYKWNDDNTIRLKDGRQFTKNGKLIELKGK